MDDDASIIAELQRQLREAGASIESSAGEAETAEATVEEYEADITAIRLKAEALERERDEARAEASEQKHAQEWSSEMAASAGEEIAALRAEVETLEAFCDRAAFLARDHMGCILANDCPPDCVWIDFCSRAALAEGECGYYHEGEQIMYGPLKGAPEVEPEPDGGAE